MNTLNSGIEIFNRNLNNIAQNLSELSKSNLTRHNTSSLDNERDGLRIIKQDVEKVKQGSTDISSLDNESYGLILNKIDELSERIDFLHKFIDFKDSDMTSALEWISDELTGLMQTIVPGLNGIGEGLFVDRSSCTEEGWNPDKLTLNNIEFKERLQGLKDQLLEEGFKQKMEKYLNSGSEILDKLINSDEGYIIKDSRLLPNDIDLRADGVQDMSLIEISNQLLKLLKDSKISMNDKGFLEHSYSKLLQMETELKASNSNDENIFNKIHQGIEDIKFLNDLIEFKDGNTQKMLQGIYRDAHTLSHKLHFLNAEGGNSCINTKCIPGKGEVVVLGADADLDYTVLCNVERLQNNIRALKEVFLKDDFEETVEKYLDIGIDLADHFRQPDHSYSIIE